MKLDTWLIDANVLLSNPDSGIDEIAVVKRPAIELEGYAFNKSEKIENILEKQYFNSEKMQIAGYFSLSDFEIYRVEPDGYKYNLVFPKEATRIMHQKMMETKLADGFKINFEHRDPKLLQDNSAILEELGFANGDVPANIFSIDYVDTPEQKEFIKQKYGIEFPKELGDAEGSFMTIQLTNEKYFKFLKDNDIKSFSLEGFFSKFYEQLKSKFNKNQEEKMDKQLFRKPTKKGAKTLFTISVKKESFATIEEILEGFPIGGNYSEIIGDETYADFTGTEEWTDVNDGTVFDVTVENGLITEVVITSEAPAGDAPEGDTQANEDQPKEGDKPEENTPVGMSAEEVEALIQAKFEEVMQPKIDEITEMITELSMKFDEAKIKEGEENLKSKKTEINKKDTFKSVIKNHFLK